LAEEFFEGGWVASKGAVGQITDASSHDLVVEVMRQRYRWERPKKSTEKWPRNLCAPVPASHIKNGKYHPPAWLRG